MQLDPEKRYLVSRPRGGFNDVMVQIEKCRLYAKKYDRVLVLDTSRSGLRLPFDQVFDIQDNFDCALLPWTPDMAPAFDAATSVRPHELRHRISTYETDWENHGNYYWDNQTGCELNFDVSKDHDEQVLVYEQAGGGPASFSALNKLCLKPEMAQRISDRIRGLGADYDAVHIRHSDYKTDFEAFLTRLRPVLRNRHVLICSDSADAIGAAASLLDPSTKVLTVTQTPDMGGAPLHTTQTLEAETFAVDFLTDLFALAFSRRLFFTTLSAGNKNGAHISGFSLLANVLNKSPDCLRRLFAHGDQSVIDTLLTRPKGIGNPARTLHLLNYFRWNRVAVTKGLSRNKRAKHRRFTPEKIGNPFRHGRPRRKGPPSNN